jgi:hypothetical protein
MTRPVLASVTDFEVACRARNQRYGSPGEYDGFARAAQKFVAAHVPAHAKNGTAPGPSIRVKVVARISGGNQAEEAKQ